ncbi:MAG: L,D-transpeptidase family protein, partial [Plesiomonas sp.]
KGMTLRIPTQMLLPDTPREGIVLNLAELRLFYYPKGSNTVEVYPIGIGRVGRSTPTMVTSIISKRANPTWTPTANTRKEYAAQGISLPAVVPAGPENPMGLFALRLAQGKGEYLIHGTNANFGIGMRVSAGCIRLRPGDIENLFNTVPVGTRVQVVNDPIKVSIEPNGQRYIEVHQPLSKNENDDPQTMVIPFSKPVQTFMLSPLTNSTTAEKEVVRRSGIPVNVTANASN